MPLFVITWCIVCLWSSRKHKGSIWSGIFHQKVTEDMKMTVVDRHTIGVGLRHPVSWCELTRKDYSYYNSWVWSSWCWNLQKRCLSMRQGWQHSALTFYWPHIRPLGKYTPSRGVRFKCWFLFETNAPFHFSFRSMCWDNQLHNYVR